VKASGRSVLKASWFLPTLPTYRYEVRLAVNQIVQNIELLTDRPVTVRLFQMLHIGIILQTVL
jgi:hypothetical protein